MRGSTIIWNTMYDQAVEMVQVLESNVGYLERALIRIAAYDSTSDNSRTNLQLSNIAQEAIAEARRMRARKIVLR